MTTAAHAYLNGNRSHWTACARLHRDYHLKGRMAYADFQRECAENGVKVSESHLRFMYGAYHTYLALVTDFGVGTVMPLRRRLEYTYFARAGQRWRNEDLELTPQQVLYWLTEAAEGRVKNSTELADALTVEAFVDGNGNGETNGRQWVRDFLPGLMRFSETPPQDVPEPVVRAVRETASLIRDWLSE